MLRITTDEADVETRLRLEGRLEGPWVRELEFAWRESAGPNLVLDLNAVSFIDQPGKELLGRMHRAGARLEASMPLTQALVEEITK